MTLHAARLFSSASLFLAARGVFRMSSFLGVCSKNFPRNFLVNFGIAEFAEGFTDVYRLCLNTTSDYFWALRVLIYTCKGHRLVFEMIRGTFFTLHCSGDQIGFLNAIRSSEMTSGLFQFTFFKFPVGDRIGFSYAVRSLASRGCAVTR